MDEQIEDPRAGEDSGFSLIEIVVAISLMAMVIVPLLLSTITLIKASDTSRISAETERVVADAADRVTRADLGCNYEQAVDAAVRSRGWDANRASAKYQYYVAGPDARTQGQWSPLTPGSASSDACPGGLRTTRLIQLVTITVVDENGKNRSMQVVKSDV